MGVDGVTGLGFLTITDCWGTVIHDWVPGCEGGG
jgi:hypothetical protein